MKNLTKIVGSLGLIGCAVVNTSVADDSGWYIGANVGETMGNIDDDSIRSQLMGTGVTSVTIDDDDRDTGYKIFGGYRYNRNFSIEGGYFNLGELGYTATTVPAGSLTGEVSLHGLNIDLVGMQALSEKFSAFGRLGVSYIETDADFSNSGVVAVPADPNPDENEMNFKFGVGLQYDMTRALALRLEAERYRVDDAVGNTGDIDLVSLGMVYRFGAGKAAPAPVRTTAAVPAERQTYCSALDIQYEINQDQIQREEVDKLRAVATYLKKYPRTTVTVQGHTDNVGTSAENQQLSLQRAKKVVDYLASKEGITRSRMTAVGYGETRPVADNRTEEGRRKNRRIHTVIECVSDIAGLTPIPARITMALDMTYDVDQAAVKPEYRNDLRKVADYLKANPRMTATVEGHTSQTRTVATAEQAMRLSQQRAQNVVNYLVEQFNVPRGRLTAKGFGETRQITYGATAERDRENRRVNIILNYPQ